jgi:AcrR family transcriptional regulator
MRYAITMNVVQSFSERRSTAMLPPMSTTDRQAALRAALIDIAERRIAERGLAALKARDLAKEAGCSLGAIYLHFPDLDALVFAVQARTLDLLDAAMSGAAGEGADPAQRILALSLAYLEWAAAHRPRWAALFEHRLPSEAEVPAAYRAQRARVFRHVEAPLAALMPGAEREALARSVFAAVHGIVSLGLDEKLETTPLPALRAQLSTVVLALARGLAAPC